MSRVLKRLHGTGTGGAWVDGDKFKMTPHFTPLRDDLDLLIGGSVFRSQPLGGSELVGMDADATGDLTLFDWVPAQIDNLSSQLSGFSDSRGASLVAQITFFLRVSNAAINITPKVFYDSSIAAVAAGGSTATLTGAAACSAILSDYSGTNQIQTVTLTLPTGLNYLRAGVTVAGTPDDSYQAWARAYLDLYVSS